MDQPNQIPQRQNEPQEIERHAARRHLYKRASLCVAAQMAFLVAAPLVWSVLIVFFPHLQVWAALFGITLSLLDALFIDQFQKALKSRAAKIQELFDCGVLEIPWNKLKAGRQPDVEQVIEYSKRYRSRVPSDQEFRDWYPPAVGSLPLHLARLVCQRTNCVWSSKLRRQFATWVLVAVALTGPTVFAIGLVGGMSLEKFVLAVLAPVLPAALWGIRTVRSHFESADATDRLAAHAEDLWEKAVKGDLSKAQCEREARALQDEIFERRKGDPIIFDWVSLDRNLSNIDLPELFAAYRSVEAELLDKYKWYFHYVVGYPSGCVNAHTHGVADNFGHMDLQIVLPISQAKIHGVFDTVMGRIKSGDRFVDGLIADRILSEPYKVKFVLSEDGGRPVMRIILPDAKGRLDPEVMESVYASQYDTVV